MTKTKCIITILVLAVCIISFTDGKRLQQKLKDKLKRMQTSRFEIATNGNILDRNHNRLIPTHYDLNLHPNIAKRELRAVVRINVTVTSVIENMWFINSNNLQDINLKVLTLDTFENVIKTRNRTIDVQLDNEALMVWDDLDAGKHIIEIEYKGPLSGNMIGLYINEFRTLDNTIEYSLATQFEPHYARRMFPCFDIPNLKATFDVHITRLPEHISISNMPIEQTSVAHIDGQRWYTDHFETSPIMSTYLLAVAVGNFKKLSRTASGVKHSIYAPDHQLDHADYALRAGIKSLTALEEYFNISYPLPKIDMIALADFKSGAMENWGLVTYRDYKLIIDLENTPMNRIESGINTIAHEMSHMWFGNLVTLNWWDETYLNEGMVSFMVPRIVEAAFGWKMEDRFYSDVTSGALDADAGTSHALKNDVTTAVEIKGSFDTIGYAKGGAIARMFENTIGGFTSFRNGIRAYLTDLSYKNALNNRLWAELAYHDSSNLFNNGKTVRKFAKQWTEQPGFPLIKVWRVQTSTQGPLDQGVDSIHISQLGRYSNNGTIDAKTAVWQTPVVYRFPSNSDETSTVWVVPGETHVSSAPASSNNAEYVLVNCDGVGFFRVIYEEQNYENLGSALKKFSAHKKISQIDRAVLIDDVFAHLHAGYLNASTVLNLIDYVRVGDDNELSLTVWSILTKRLNKIEMLLRETSIHKSFKKYLGQLYARVYKYVLFNKHLDHEKRRLQSKIIYTAIRNNADNKAFNAASRWYDRLRLKDNEIEPSPDVMEAILNHGIQISSYPLDDFNDMFKKYENSYLPVEQLKYLTAMTATRRPECIQRLLMYTLEKNGTMVSGRNSASDIYSNIFRNDDQHPQLWTFVKENLAEIKAHYTPPLLFSRLINTFGKSADQKLLDDITEFAKSLVGDDKSAFDGVVKSIKSNIKWVKENQGSIQKWLEENVA